MEDASLEPVPMKNVLMLVLSDSFCRGAEVGEGAYKYTGSRTVDLSFTELLETVAVQLSHLTCPLRAQ